MRLVALAALSPTLFACTDPRTPDSAEPPAPPPALAGVQLDQPVRLIGTEPFWRLEVTAEALTYYSAETGAETAAARAGNPGPTVQGTVATWSAEADGGRALEILLTATDCSDGMSDRTYPLTAQVTLGETRLQGCAAQTAAFDRTGESGRVE